MTTKAWSHEDLARLQRLRRAGYSLSGIGYELGRSKGAVEHRLRRMNYFGLPKAHIVPVKQSTPPSEDALAEMWRRRELEHQTITASLCGDPLPGHSALDRAKGVMKRDTH